MAIATWSPRSESERPQLMKIRLLMGYCPDRGRKPLPGYDYSLPDPGLLRTDGYRSPIGTPGAAFRCPALAQGR